MEIVKPIRVKQNDPENNLPTVFVGRGSGWENPFRVIRRKDNSYSIALVKKYITPPMLALYDTYDITWLIGGSKEEMERYALGLFREYLMPYNHGEDTNTYIISDAFLKAIKSTLKGKNLRCTCSIGKPCHADVLLNIANSNEKF